MCPKPFSLFRRGLKKTSTYRTNLIISRTRMFNHTSLALKLNVQNANGSTIDVLATTSYVKKGKQARIQEKQTINVTSASCFLFVCLFVFFFILKWQ